ncbi:protein-glutamate methylesterase/protein-glutamine glutaminase [Clostridium manihotivorum]|uniref:Protein-glutamate methylesterase/protein-glutamine glutaminase n=1 Tax=Clostridium manihotivorum TaxID=2320868 RepID=A0A410DRF9_9CLOT|nr:chemotaxis response regulator protein-glutamate methylesterase [Clostridium manihotivorum]QAA31630.1 chemotaxis response regulator protein-glutamate methylesterase [Clostridium manihotivorum]
MNKIKVMVVDDSALMRKIISDMINEETDMEVIATARNGEEFVEKVGGYNPDVITLDVEMPKMDGITALKKLKLTNRNAKVIMLSSLTTSSSRTTLDCLDAGAADFVSKPSGSISLDINKVKLELVHKIRAVASIKKSLFDFKVEKKEPARYVTNSRATGKIEAVVIGASTGGPRALQTVLTELPGDLGVPVLVVQHMPAGFTKTFAERLNNLCNLKVVEAENNMNIERNVIYIAPGGFHMEISKDKKISLNQEPSIWGVRPAVDKLFHSSATVYGKNQLSVVLTGMGKDGAQGTVSIKNAGGHTISEDESTCTIYGMPKATFETGKVDEVLPLGYIAKKIATLVKG